VTFTYTNPASSTMQAIRFRIGDTVSTDPQLTDEEINYVVGVQSKVSLAAAQCCEAIAAKYARQVNTSNISLSIGAAERMKHYQALATTLRQQANRDAEQNATILVGGAVQADVDEMNDDSTYVQPSFKVGGDDYRRPATMDAEDTI
jgi:hypothetical protein